jgi:hypothetical protein
MKVEDARDIWAQLGSEGKAPEDPRLAAEVLPAYTVAIDPWINRLSKKYLSDLSRRRAHHKLVLAPYGGGKTHFLLAVGNRARQEEFAVAYIPCNSGVSLANSADLYCEFMKRLRLPGGDKPGARALIKQLVARKKQEVMAAPDPDAAFQAWTETIAERDDREPAFGRVLAEAIRFEADPGRAVAGEAPLRWLRGEFDTLTKEELTALRLAKVPKKRQEQLGKDLLLSVLSLVTEAGARGTVLLVDEVETLFTSRGKALSRLLHAMQALIDDTAGQNDGVPLLSLYAATPEVLEVLPKYAALEQRLKVAGSSFAEGNDLAPQLHLEALDSPQQLLTALGEKLIELGELATGHHFDAKIQRDNARRLARAAAERNLEVDARRLFVKTWVNLLDLQANEVERSFHDDELSRRYQGAFDAIGEFDKKKGEEP